ncbi:MAG: GNAT family N-acetyltransferase [Dehalococcoidales bacterium]|nr:GNAT family N-acetyltransferase [Dehalococcoidales bacterium]
MLQGEKVVLRPVRRADIESFLKWFNDPEVTRYLKMYLPMTEMAEEKFIEELGTTGAVAKVIFVIEAIDGKSTKPIGNIALSNIHPKDHHAVFGIAIGERDYWSKGYGTEAARLLIRYGFEQLNLHRINSSAFSFNERSIKLHKRIGFTEEGRQREADYKNGAYHDRVIFGLLRNEWQKHNPKENK